MFHMFPCHVNEAVQGSAKSDSDPINAAEEPLTSPVILPTASQAQRVYSELLLQKTASYYKGQDDSSPPSCSMAAAS